MSLFCNFSSLKIFFFQKSLISKYLKVKVAVGDSSNIYLFRLIKILKPQTIFEKSIFGLKKSKINSTWQGTQVPTVDNRTKNIFELWLPVLVKGLLRFKMKVFKLRIFRWRSQPIKTRENRSWPIIERSHSTNLKT